MMLNSKFGVALLAIFACGSVSAKDNSDNNKKRMLRNGNGNRRRGNNQRRLAVNKGANTRKKADDITEDVAFWTRALQVGSMTPRPTKRPTGTGPIPATSDPTRNPTKAPTRRPTKAPTRRPTPGA